MSARHPIIDLAPRDVHGRRGRARIIDVREPHELAGELGRISDCEHVPLGTVEQACAHWSLDDEIIVVCRSGGRSGKAAQALSARGFRRIHNMTGGMLAWNADGLPVARDQRG